MWVCHMLIGMQTLDALCPHFEIGDVKRSLSTIALTYISQEKRAHGHRVFCRVCRCGRPSQHWCRTPLPSRGTETGWHGLGTRRSAHRNPERKQLVRDNTGDVKAAFPHNARYQYYCAAQTHSVFITMQAWPQQSVWHKLHNTLDLLVTIISCSDNRCHWNTWK